ncbi:hypothetical protein ABZ553_14585 [Streptomyces sparsogenes]|uniref:hypothetical protein n=1 Tax=Streptomyces sparsogenes TaxID=67365 RepID=UPI0033FB46CA
MSTNYFAFGPFPGGEADSEGLHIGQHAGGWEFLWHAHNDHGLTCTDTWLRFLSREGVTIETEYGTVVPLTDFWKHATLRPAEANPHMSSRATAVVDWRDRRGCPFYDGDFC